MELLNLPDDVLREILKACDRVSLVHLSLTSSKAYASCSPYSLHEVYLHRDLPQVTSFLALIINHTQLVVGTGSAKTTVINGPGAHVRVMDLDLGIFEFACYVQARELDMTWARDLSRALSLMPNLRSLKTSHSGRLLTHHPGLAKTLMSLQNLCHLLLTGIDKPAAEQLSMALTTRSKERQIQMHLESIVVELTKDAPLTPLVDHGVGDLLFYNKSSLKTISLINCDLVGFLSQPDVVFPSVKSLSLSTYRGTLDTIARSFPNVYDIRLANLMQQAAENKALAYSMHTVSNIPGPIPFAHLLSASVDECEMTLLDKCLGRPVPPLRRMGLTQYLPAGLRLPRHYPDLRSLHLHSVALWPDNQWQHLIERLPCLSFLQVNVSIKKSEKESDFITRFGRLPQLLAPLPLEYIAVNRPSKYYSPSQSFPPQKDIALLFARGIPSLQYLDVIDRCDIIGAHQERTHWRVDSNANKAIMEGAKVQEQDVVRLIRLDDEDGTNAHEHFDWKDII